MGPRPKVPIPKVLGVPGLRLDVREYNYLKVLKDSQHTSITHLS